ncbi:MAG TPA: amidase family protein, partial [Longimicrobiaceae bacterium]|nr:amidase family protein [Longimicrobiaceae bacterium]
MTAPSGDPLALLPAHELARRVRARELSAEEVLEACLERVERLNPALNAVVTLDPRAREQARGLDLRLARGEDPGILAGLPVGIKDVTQVGGLRCTFGSPLFADHVPE